MTELETLFENRSMGFDLEETGSRKGEIDMKNFLRDLCFWVIVGGSLSIAAYSYAQYQEAQSASGVTPQKSKSTTETKQEAVSGATKEELMLRKIYASCNPIIPLFRDKGTCKLWLREYRNLTTYDYSDGDVLIDGVETQAVASTTQPATEPVTSGILKLSPAPGNAQSPTY